MINFVRFVFSFFLSAILMSGAAFAQDSKPKTDLVINDIAGNWRIEVIGRPDDDFKGTASIPRAPSASDTSIMAETITEDKCCGGRNHARVLQDSRITITEDGDILVDSKIIKYLLREEELDMTYSPDDFELRWQDSNTLIGEANGWTPVRWVREKDLIS